MADPRDDDDNELDPPEARKPAEDASFLPDDSFLLDLDDVTPAPTPVDSGGDEFLLVDDDLALDAPEAGSKVPASNAPASPPTPPAPRSDAASARTQLPEALGGADMAVLADELAPVPHDVVEASTPAPVPLPPKSAAQAAALAADQSDATGGAAGQLPDWFRPQDEALPRFVSDELEKKPAAAPAAELAPVAAPVEETVAEAVKETVDEAVEAIDATDVSVDTVLDSADEFGVGAPALTALGDSIETTTGVPGARSADGTVAAATDATPPAATDTADEAVAAALAPSSETGDDVGRGADLRRVLAATPEPAPALAPIVPLRRRRVLAAAGMLLAGALSAAVLFELDRRGVVDLRQRGAGDATVAVVPRNPRKPAPAGDAPSGTEVPDPAPSEPVADAGDAPAGEPIALDGSDATTAAPDDEVVTAPAVPEPTTVTAPEAATTTEPPAGPTTEPTTEPSNGRPTEPATPDATEPVAVGAVEPEPPNPAPVIASEPPRRAPVVAEVPVEAERRPSPSAIEAPTATAPVPGALELASKRALPTASAKTTRSPLTGVDTIIQLKNGHLFRGRVLRVRDTRLTLRVGAGECVFDLAEIDLLDSSSEEYRREADLPEASVVLANGQRLRGRLMKQTADSVVLVVANGQVVCPRADVREVSFTGRVHF